MNTSDRTETKYNKLIGRIGDSYYFLDDIFKYKDDFKGATGTVLEPVSQESYDETMTVDGFKDRGYDEHWKGAVESGSTELGLDDWLQLVLDQYGDEAVYDLSGYSDDLWDQLRDIGLTEEKYPIFTCVGGGRSFSPDMVWDELYNPELWEKIKEVEGKEGTK